jgi:hypothetical protein
MHPSPTSNLLKRAQRTSYWIDGEIRTRIVDQKQNVVGATFRLKFAVQNAKKTVTGVCDDVLLIREASSNPKIIGIKAKTISRSEEPIRR